jgi:ABC-type multidrug transport system fused ATPase/permease subunit
MAGVISDAISHSTTVKSFAAEDYKKASYKSLNKYVDAQYWSWMTSIPADLGRMFLAAAATFLLLIFTSCLYEQNKTSIAIVILVQLCVIKLVIAT